MRNILFLSALISLIIIGCSKKDNPNPEVLYDFPKVNSVDGKYLFSKEEHTLPSIIGGTAIFQFQGNKLSKRTGGYMDVYGSGGISKFYTTEIYDDIEYNSANSITITTKNNLPGLIVDPSKREIEIQNGLIVKKITSSAISSSVPADVINYFYDNEKNLVKTEQLLDYAIIIKDFLYANGNLQKISTIKKDREDGFVYYTSEETFGGYDNKPNPLKGQTLWQDMLYRTLSKNNFTTYSYTKGTDHETRNWNLIYDVNGNVDFSK